MAKARVCDICGQLMNGERTVVKVAEVKEGGEARDLKTIASFDMHKSCVKELLAAVKERKAS